jgi:hypothetical protein
MVWGWIVRIGAFVLGIFGGMTILVVSSFYLAISFSPLVLSMDFGVKRSLYGIFGQFGDTQVTERSSETVDLIYYQNISFIAGYSKSANPSTPAGRKWQLAGFVVGDYVFAAYQTVQENNSGVGAYLLKKVHDTRRQQDFYVGYLIANDSTGVISRCPYVGSFAPMQISDAEIEFPSIKRDCAIIDFSR